MRYISVFNAKREMTDDECALEWQEWISKCRNEVLHHGCNEIERFETFGDSPSKVFFMIDTKTPSVVDMLNQHFGKSWISEIYPVHLSQDIREDHSVIGG